MPERPEALSLQVQKAVALLDAQLALLRRQVTVKIDLPAAELLAVLQSSVRHGDTGEFHQDSPGSCCSPHTAQPRRLASKISTSVSHMGN
jgi:hypothetical protein